MGELKRVLAVAFIICCLIGVAYAGTVGNDTGAGEHVDPSFFGMELNGEEIAAVEGVDVRSASLQALIEQNSDATIKIGDAEIPFEGTGQIPVSVANLTGVEGVGFSIFFDSWMMDIEDSGALVVAPGLPAGTLVTYNVTHWDEEEYWEELHGVPGAQLDEMTTPYHPHGSLLRVAVTIPSETPLNIGTTPEDLVLITVNAQPDEYGEAWLDFNWAEWSHGFEAFHFDWDNMHSGMVTVLPPELPDLAVNEIISPNYIKKYKNGTIMMDPTFVIRNVGLAPVNEDFKVQVTFVDKSEEWTVQGYTIPVNSNFTIYTDIILDPSYTGTEVIESRGADSLTLEITHGEEITTGMKKIAIEINPEPRAFEEIRYDNNYHEMQAWVTYPDLVPVLDTTLIEGLSSSRTVVDADLVPGTHRVTYGVSNDGDVDALPTYLRVARDGVDQFISVPALAPGENWTASETIQLDKTKGVKTYTVEVNSRGPAQQEPTERILNPDQGEVSKTITSEFASVKPVTVVLPHVTGASAEIKDVPIVLTNVSEEAPVRSFSIPVTYDPTVCRFVGSAPVDGVTVTNPGYGRLLVQGTNVNYADDTTVAILRFQAQSEAGRISELGSATSASVRTDNNNFLELEITRGTFTQDRVTDARVSLWAPTSGPVGSTVSFSVSVWNTKATPVNVSANVTTGGAVLWEQDEIALGAYQSRSFTVNTWQPDTPGQQTLTATIAGDEDPTGNVATRTIRIDTYDLEITNQNKNSWNQWYGFNRSVVQGNSVMLGTYYTANQPGQVNARLRMWYAGNGSEIDLTKNHPIQMSSWHPAERTFYGYNSNWNSAIWYSIVPRELGTFNYSIELEARGASDYVNGTLVVREPFVDIKVLRSTSLDGDAAAGEIEFEIFNRKPSEGREITITASAGAEGRTLQGLEYLIGYPHGCPEQTMSPAFAALRVKQYYAEHGGLTDSMNASVQASMDQAFDRMKATSTQNPQRLDTTRFSQDDYGAWAWGTRSSPSLFYTLQPNYVFSELKKDMINDPGYWNVDIFNTTEINLSASTLWLIDQQIETGTHAGGWHSWGYISNRYEWTGFVSEKFVGEFEFLTPATQALVNQSLNRSVEYLLTDGKDTSTAKALAFRIFGLHAIKEHYSDNQDLVERIDLKIPELRDALIADRKTDAAGNFYWEDGWYAESEATAYAILALNRSGLPNDNEYIAGGLRYLISQYDTNGRWGNTRATGAVVNTLMELQVKTVFDFTADIGVYHGQTEIRAPETLTFDNANVRHSISLTPQQINALYGDDVANRYGRVAITGKSDAGDDAVKMVVAVQSFEKVPLSVARANFGPVDRIPEEFIDPIATDFFLDVTIPVDVPAGLKVGDDVDVVFTVDNTGPGNMNQTVMILEIPIGAGVNFTGPDNGENSAYYLSDPSDPTSKAYLSHMANRTAGRLFVYPGSDDESQPSIVAGEIKNFFVPLRFEESGSQTVEARVYPMYDDEWMAVGDATTEIRGFGTLTVSAVDEDGDPINADFYVNDISVGTGVNTTTIERIEDTYRVAIYGTGVDRWLNTTLRVNTGEVTDYSAQFVTDTRLPHITTVTGAAGDVLVMPPEIEETISETSSNHWNAAVKAKQVYNSTISSSGGMATIAVDVPIVERLPSSPGNRPNSTLLMDVVTFSYHNASGWQGPFNYKGDVVDGTLIIEGVDTATIDKVIFEFAGRKLGDVEKTGTIDIGDALEVLWYTVGARPDWEGNDLFYADVENTGQVDIGDALELLWYTVGARDNYYQPL